MVAALIGKVPQEQLMRARLCSNVKLCIQVYEEACKTMDPGILRSFVERAAGRKRKLTGATQKRGVKARNAAIAPE